MKPITPRADAAADAAVGDIPPLGAPSASSTGLGDVWNHIVEWSSQAGNGSQEAIEYLNEMARWSMYQLLSLASQGHKKASAVIVPILADHLSNFQSVCVAFPENFAPIACKRASWPGFVSINADVKEDNDKLIAILKLGSEADLNYSGSSRSTVKQWSVRTPSNKVALLLYNTVESYWQKAKIWPHWHGVIEGRPHIGPACLRDPRWRKHIEGLKPMDRDTFPDWFKASLPLLPHFYGEKFHLNGVFDGYREKASFLEDDPRSPGAKRPVPRAPALIQTAIKKDLRQSFHSMAKK